MSDIKTPCLVCKAEISFPADCEVGDETVCPKCGLVHWIDFDNEEGKPLEILVSATSEYCCQKHGFSEIIAAKDVGTVFIMQCPFCRAEVAESRVRELEDERKQIEAAVAGDYCQKKILVILNGE